MLIEFSLESLDDLQNILFDSFLWIDPIPERFFAKFLKGCSDIMACFSWYFYSLLVSLYHASIEIIGWFWIEIKGVSRLQWKLSISFTCFLSINLFWKISFPWTFNFSSIVFYCLLTPKNSLFCMRTLMISSIFTAWLIFDFWWWDWNWNPGFQSLQRLSQWHSLKRVNADWLHFEINKGEMRDFWIKMRRIEITCDNRK
jgi:hypothetical protein